MLVQVLLNIVLGGNKMKIGIRSPSLTKSFKARTTGKLKRQIKKSVNPLYGKKGIGLINNPKKAFYNKIYNKTTIDSLATLKKVDSNKMNNKNTKKTLKKSFSLTDENIKKLINTETITMKTNIVRANNNDMTVKTSLPTKKELLAKIPKEKQVHYLDKEAHCCICDKDLGLKTLRNRYQLIDGWLCKNCVKSFCNPFDFEWKRYTVEIVKNKINTKQAHSNIDFEK